MYNLWTRTSFFFANYSRPSSQHLHNKIQHQQQPSPVCALLIIARVVIATLRTRLARQLWNFQVAHNCCTQVYRTPHFRCSVAMRSFWVPGESLHHPGINWGAEGYNGPLSQLSSRYCYGHGRDSTPPPPPPPPPPIQELYLSRHPCDNLTVLNLETSRANLHSST